VLFKTGEPDSKLSICGERSEPISFENFVIVEISLTIWRGRDQDEL